MTCPECKECVSSDGHADDCSKRRYTAQERKHIATFLQEGVHVVTTEYQRGYAAGLEAGRAAERAAVVHWLDTSEEYACDVAKQIDRGDHTEGAGPAKGKTDDDRA